MAVSLYENHRPREATITVSKSPDFSGDFVCAAGAVNDSAEIQAAIDYVIALEGGVVLMLRGEYYLEDVVIVDGPAYIKGEGMTWQGTGGGTNLSSIAGLAGENMFEFFNAGDLFHFAGMSDLNLINTHGNHSVLIRGLADASFRRIYFNQGAENAIYILGDAFDLWNFWIQDCLFENIVGAGIKVDSADHDIVKGHILDNYFFACDLGVVLQEFVDVGGKMSYWNIRGNQIFNTLKTGIQLWKECDHISIKDNILYDIGTTPPNTNNGIRVGDSNDPASKCEWISIIGNIIDGGGNTKWGIALEDSTNYVTVVGNQIHGCATAPYYQEGTVTNVDKAHNMEA